MRLYAIILCAATLAVSIPEALAIRLAYYYDMPSLPRLKTERSDSCKAFLNSDLTHKDCFFAPIAVDPENLKNRFNKLCSKPICSQEKVDAYAVQMTQACHSDIQPPKDVQPDDYINDVKIFFSWYTTFLQVNCYVDEDGEYVSYKARAIHAGLRTKPAETEICTEGNQYSAGTIINIMEEKPAHFAPWVSGPKYIRDFWRMKCGTEWINKFPKTVGPPYSVLPAVKLPNLDTQNINENTIDSLNANPLLDESKESASDVETVVAAPVSDRDISSNTNVEDTKIGTSPHLDTQRSIDTPLATEQLKTILTNLAKERAPSKESEEFMDALSEFEEPATSVRETVTASFRKLGAKILKIFGTSVQREEADADIVDADDSNLRAILENQHQSVGNASPEKPEEILSENPAKPDTNPVPTSAVKERPLTVEDGALTGVVLDKPGETDKGLLSLLDENPRVKLTTRNAADPESSHTREPSKPVISENKVDDNKSNSPSKPDANPVPTRAVKEQPLIVDDRTATARVLLDLLENRRVKDRTRNAADPGSSQTKEPSKLVISENEVDDKKSNSLENKNLPLQFEEDTISIPDPDSDAPNPTFPALAVFLSVAGFAIQLQ